MKKTYQLTFYKSELNQCKFILDNDEIQSKISLFLLKYVTIEAFYKKLLIAEKQKDGKILSQKDKKNLRVLSTDVKRVLNYFDVEFEDELVERIFGSNDSNYMECSVKKLRDRMVHNTNDNVLRCIIERFESINKDMDNFISLF